jgi:lysophospholipase L1-like esterase
MAGCKWIAVALASSVIACSAANAPSSPAPPGAVATRAVAEAGIRFTGRVERTGPRSGRYAWSGSGFVAAFQGTGVAVMLGDKDNQHTVLIDGQPGDILKPRPSERRYVLGRGLTLGRHVLEVQRRTEALFGPTELFDVEVEGGELLPPPPAPERRLELLGDSISCGYGNEGANTECHFSADTENHFLSYGALTARALGAELSTVAWSGRGVVKNYNGEPGDPMPVLFERVLPEQPQSQWDFSREPHALVINLGTNDFSTEPDPPESEFVGAYRALLARARDKYPHAFVLSTVGPVLAGQDLARAQAGIAEAVRQRRAAGDQRVAFYAMQTPNPRPGCDWHPSTTTHQKMAEELTRELRRVLAW